MTPHSDRKGRGGGKWALMPLIGRVGKRGESGNIFFFSMGKKRTE